MAAGTPPAPLATVDDLEDYLGEDIPVDKQRRAESLLRRAATEIREHCKQTWLDTDGTLTEVPGVVETVCVEVAARVYLNPEGYATENDGDYGYGRGGDAMEAGTVCLSPGQQKRLTPHVIQPQPSAHPGLRTLATTRCDEESPMSPVDFDPFGAGWPAP